MTAFFGAMIVLLLAAAAVLSVTWPPARYLISVAWMMPIVELTLLGIGQLHYRLRGRVAPGKYHHLIIQITTTGREHGRVSEIIRQIRGYHLTMAHQIWVVLEPGHNTQYPDADRVVVVPRDFTSQGAAKARALEWSRLVRHTMGLERGDVKILFCDDDVSLTRQYIERAFIADYDICEGVVTPRTAYGPSGTLRSVTPMTSAPTPAWSTARYFRASSTGRCMCTAKVSRSPARQKDC